MAAGSQLENGICALFVMAATVMSAADSAAGKEENILLIIQCPWLRRRPMVRRISASPTRFIRAVIIPAARDFGF